jgi:hypothetical protein
MDFLSTHICSVKKAANSANFTSGGIINRKAQHNSLRRDKSKRKVVYKGMSYVTLSRRSRTKKEQHFMSPVF